MAVLDLRRLGERADVARPVNVAAVALLGGALLAGLAGAWALQHWAPLAAGAVLGLLLMPAGATPPAGDQARG